MLSYFHRYLTKRREHIADLNGSRILRAESEVELAIQREQTVVDPGALFVRFKHAELRAKCVLRRFDGVERLHRLESKNRRAQAGDVPGRHEDGLSQNVGIDLVQGVVPLRNAAAIDDAVDHGAVLFHALEDDPGVKGSALDCRKEFVSGRGGQVPPKRHSAQLRIHQDRAIAIVPGKAQQAGLAGAIRCHFLRKSSRR